MGKGNIGRLVVVRVSLQVREQSAERGRQWRRHGLPALQPIGDEQRAQQAARGALDIALGAGDLSGEVQAWLTR